MGKMNKLSKRGAGKEKESRLLITAVILLFIVLNLLLAFLANTYGWYFLAVDPMFYDISGVTDEYFEKVNPEGKRVEFYFCMSRAALTENNTFGRILDTVEQFDERYDFFTVKHLDTYYDYEILERFSKDEAGNEIDINSQSVIVYSPESGAPALVRSLSTFYYYDTEDTTNDDMIFNGEEIVASLVGAALEKDRPDALFTTGHGESPTASFMNAFYSAGYDVVTGDLTAEDIPEGTEIVVIASPKYDFEEYADKTIACEISRLADFVRAGGTVIYLRSTGAGSLPRLESFYSRYGIVAEGGMITDSTHSVDTTGKSVLLRYDAGEGASALRDYALSYNASRLVAAGASPIRVETVTGATAVPLCVPTILPTPACRVIPFRLPLPRATRWRLLPRPRSITVSEGTWR
ncbi:MAG: hypothetical protein E7609_02640 [Ruminococcaceae bacterium]|nr:hypothetical protein [Oscillospiraceae bacterium]